jgi:hypothetical protein
MLPNLFRKFANKSERRGTGLRLFIINLVVHITLFIACISNGVAQSEEEI